MPETSSASLRLAGHLRSLDDETLAELVGAREARAPGIADFFDLADALLDPTSVHSALSRLDRPTLTALAAAARLENPTAHEVATLVRSSGARDDVDLHAAIGARLDACVRLALVERAPETAEPAHTAPVGYAVWPPVATVLAGWTANGLPGLPQLASVPAPPALGAVAVGDPRFLDRGAAERAFTATTAVAEILAELHREPARKLSKGGIALPDLRRLATATSCELGDVAAFVAITERAGLVAPELGRWMPTAAATDWLALASAARWGVLAGAWHDRLPGDIQRLLASRAHVVWGDSLRVYVDWLYPAGGEWMHERLSAYTRDAELLGITAHHTATTAGVALLGASADEAAEIMGELFPAEVDRVYVQHDLTIVSPGPLAAMLAERLRTMADVEGHGLASSYRMSAASLTRALAAGDSAASIREFLAGISLTGIPQPLDYLIAETAARHGLIRVGSLGAHPSARSGARSYVRSEDPHLLGTVLVDQSLAPLGFARVDAGMLYSRFDRDVVFWSLADARYPVAAENEAGHAIPVERHRAHPRPVVPPGAPALAFVRRLRGTGSGVDIDDRAWLARQLDLAVRNKVAVRVTVAMPDGSTVDYQLEPSSVAAGRLRARDRAADLERTLPLASITALALL